MRWVASDNQASETCAFLYGTLTVEDVTCFAENRGNGVGHFLGVADIDQVGEGLSWVLFKVVEPESHPVLTGEAGLFTAFEYCLF